MNLTHMVGGGRVRVVEKGGDVLSNLLGRNDPWGSPAHLCECQLRPLQVQDVAKGPEDEGQETRLTTPRGPDDSHGLTVQEGGLQLLPPVHRLCTGGGESGILGGVLEVGKAEDPRAQEGCRGRPCLGSNGPTRH